jgi:hypothetical protein
LASEALANASVGINNMRPPRTKLQGVIYMTPSLLLHQLKTVFRAEEHVLLERIGRFAEMNENEDKW